MRWSELFADLEAQAEAWERAELDTEIAERIRAEQGRVAWIQRLSAAVGSGVVVDVQGAGEQEGALATLGADWLLLERQQARGEVLVLLHAVLCVHDLGRRAHADSARSQVLARLGVASPMRAVMRDRSTVLCRLRDGTQRTGTLERVGADHLDLALGDAGGSSRGPRVTLPFAAVSTLTRAPSGWT